MNNPNVIALPASESFTPKQALQAALNFDDLTDVLIIGYSESRDLVVRSSRMTRADALFMLEVGKNWAMNGGRE